MFLTFNPKKNIMKSNLFFLIPALTLALFVTSCSKSDTTPPANSTPQGNWVGGQNNNIGGPVFYFALNLKANGVLVVSANSATAPDIANGTWSLVADSVRATYTFVGSSATYSLAGKYSTSSNIMAGTFGVGSSTTGSGVFSVTKQ